MSKIFVAVCILATVSFVVAQSTTKSTGTTTAAPKYEYDEYNKTCDNNRERTKFVNAQNNICECRNDWMLSKNGKKNAHCYRPKPTTTTTPKPTTTTSTTTTTTSTTTTRAPTTTDEPGVVYYEKHENCQYKWGKKLDTNSTFINAENDECKCIEHKAFQDNTRCVRNKGTTTVAPTTTTTAESTTESSVDTTTTTEAPAPEETTTTEAPTEVPTEVPTTVSE